MSISLNNSRDQISFSWSGNASDDPIFTDLSTGSTVSIKPFSHWSQGSYYYPLAIAKGKRAIHGSNWTWGIDGLFSTIHRQKVGEIQWRHWLPNHPTGDAWHGASYGAWHGASYDAWHGAWHGAWHDAWHGASYGAWHGTSYGACPRWS